MIQPVHVALTYDAHGVAGVTASNTEEAFYGIGMLHARHRQSQALRVWSAALGQLSTSLLGAIAQSPTYELDELAHRIEAPRLGAEAWTVMRAPERDFLQAYVDGFVAEARRVGPPWERFILGLLPLEQVTPAAVLSGALFMAYHSQARGHARMEQLMLQLLQAGASPASLRELHSPYLDAWRPEDGPDSAAYGAILGAQLGGSSTGHSAGGSNAWALDETRTESGTPMLFGDPHLNVGELPGSFFEVRVRLPEGHYWLGGTLPGLPAVVVGRNATLAWSNTHACAKALDSSLLRVDANARVSAVEGSHVLQERPAVLGPSWAPWARRQISLWQSPWGAVLQSTQAGQKPKPGVYFSQRWAAGQTGGQLADSVASYMGLALCANVSEAEDQMRNHQTFTFHMVYADRMGDVGYQQVGGVPLRERTGRRLLAPWLPHDARTPQPPWGTGMQPLPKSGGSTGVRPEHGFIVSANEAQPAPDGAALAPFAQPNYRYDRIIKLLGPSTRHTFKADMQLDVFSTQAALLTPLFLEALGQKGAVAQALQHWDQVCSLSSVGAHAFDVAYQASLHGLADELGGTGWHHALHTTEVSVWWAKALDAQLARSESWDPQTVRGKRLRQALEAIRDEPLRPWGEVQTVEPGHPLAGLVPLAPLRKRWGLTTAQQPLPGSLATVRQGNLVPDGPGRIPVAAAYRMACDLATDEVQTSLPSGPNEPDRGQFLADWHRGDMHTLRPPSSNESSQIAP